MDTYSALLLVIHIVAIVLLAGPFYALMIVNERALLGRGMFYWADRYMEDIIRTHLTRCCVYNWTAMITGLLLIITTKGSLAAVFANWILPAKIVLLGTNMLMRGYSRHIIQPKIDRLLAQVNGDPIPDEIVGQVRPLRLLRKKITTVCFFDVLVLIILGVQLARPLPAAGILAFVLLAALFTARAFKTTIRHGWF